MRMALSSWRSASTRGSPNGRLASLARVERDFGGPKHPQMLVAGIGYRTLLEEDEAALVSFILGLPWVQPDRLILIVNPEDGDMQIHRPTAADRVIEHGTPS